MVKLRLLVNVVWVVEKQDPVGSRFGLRKKVTTRCATQLLKRFPINKAPKEAGQS